MDYYEILGLDIECSQEDIISSYESLKRQYEDLANKEFLLKQLDEAYNVLSNPVFREAYHKKQGYQEIEIEEKKSDFPYLILVLVIFIIVSLIVFKGVQ